MCGAEKESISQKTTKLVKMEGIKNLWFFTTLCIKSTWQKILESIVYY